MEQNLLTQKDDVVQIPDIRFEEREPFEKGFSDYFDKHVKPAVLEIEFDRLNRLATNRKRKIFSFVATVLAAVAFMAVIRVQDVHYKNMQLLFMLFGFGALSSWIYAYAPVFYYGESFRARVLPLVVKFFGQDFKAVKGGEVPLQDLKDSKIVWVGNSQQVFYTVTGTWQGSPIRLYRITTTTNQGKSHVLGFEGVFVVLPVGRKFKGATTITVRWGGQIDVDYPEGMRHVELESNQFEKMYDVYSTDQVEARYLLTPDVMEVLMGLNEAFGKCATQCSFTNGNLHVALRLPQGWFLPKSIERSVLDLEDIHSFLRQMHGVCDLTLLLK